jgi:hypothetical protein
MLEILVVIAIMESLPPSLPSAYFVKVSPTRTHRPSRAVNVTPSAPRRNTRRTAER